MKEPHLGFWGCFPVLLLLFVSLYPPSVHSQSGGGDDGAAMEALSKSIGPNSLGWSGTDYCNGTLLLEIQKLSNLQRLEVQNNQLTGPFPSLSGLQPLQVLLAHDNNFSSFPSDFFSGLTSLDSINIDHNPLAAWQIPDTIMLREFSATETNITGRIPDIFTSSNFPGLTELHLAFNYLEGELPASFSSLSIQSRP
ncbi:hypothetical protein FF1_006058 [Malus domestica]